MHVSRKRFEPEEQRNLLQTSCPTAEGSNKCRRLYTPTTSTAVGFTSKFDQVDMLTMRQLSR